MKATYAPSTRAVLVALLMFVSAADAQQSPPQAPPWRDLVKAEGHADEIPAQWLDTAEGHFAHSIRIPNPVCRPWSHRGVDIQLQLKDRFPLGAADTLNFD